MTHTIGQRLYDLWGNALGKPVAYHEWITANTDDKHAWETAATELPRGVLTGEIPLPDELTLNIPLAQAIKAMFSLIRDETGEGRKIAEQLSLQANVMSELECRLRYETSQPWTDHISDASK